LGQPLGLNIQYILEDIEFDSEDSVGMKADNMEPTNAEEGAARAQPKPLSPIPEAGTASRALTPKSASRSKRPQASEASKSESSAKV
jgi:hypothetical protein